MCRDHHVTKRKVIVQLTDLSHDSFNNKEYFEKI